MPVLKLANHDEKKEIDFGLNFLLSLTTSQRFTMMEEKSRYMKEMLYRNGHQKPAEIIKRK
jgi:hypothetical protein